jgi:hypothetical protein
VDEARENPTIPFHHETPKIPERAEIIDVGGKVEDGVGIGSANRKTAPRVLVV